LLLREDRVLGALFDLVDRQELHGIGADIGRLVPLPDHLDDEIAGLVSVASPA